MYFLQSVCVNSFTSYEFLYKIQHTKHNGISLSKVDVLSGWFSGMLLSNVLRLCSLDNDQDVTSTSTRFTYFIVSKGLLFFTLDFHFFLILFFKTDLDSMNLIFKT